MRLSPDTPRVYHRIERKDPSHMLHSPTATPPALTYLVAGMTCDHCTVAVTDEVTRVPGVAGVEVDLDTKLVRIHGTPVDPIAVAVAVAEAGYEAVVA
jgi:copper chaperone